MARGRGVGYYPTCVGWADPFCPAVIGGFGPICSCRNHRMKTYPSSPGPISILVAWAILACAPLTSRAVPSFARQMNMQCIACHTEFPILNEFGRQFKLSGYTMSTGQAEAPPFAFMLQPSFTHTQSDQSGGAAPGFGDNNNFALTQASVFYAGRLFGPYAAKLFGADNAAFANKLGIFLQTTYDGIGKAWSWDMAELRFADSTTAKGKSITYGVYANNSPTMQDPWNSTPAWGFPFTGSGLAPSPAAGTLIDGGVAQEVVGVGGYAMIANSVYLDFAGYRTLDRHTQRALGVDPEGETQITRAAPYWRLAVVHAVGAGMWQVGTFGLAADTYPGRDPSAGHDRIVDVGLDSQYQISFAQSDVTALVSWIHEHDQWHASQALGETSKATDSLRDFKATLSYLADKTYGVTGQYFAKDGDRDALLYSDSANASPRSDGFVFQANYLPLNKGGGPAFWSRSNVKLAVQYTIYNHFDGAKRNYDGAGTNAHAHNTLYLEAWVLF
jgi:hypothetical protein